MDMKETPGGHFVVPLEHVAFAKEDESDVAKEYHENLVGDEADAIMIILMTESEDYDALQLFHDEVGHSIFLSLALTQDEKEQVDKVHRYFSHRSGRRIWELFSKARRLAGKRQHVLEVIENCKICSKHKKSSSQTKSWIACHK